MPLERQKYNTRNVDWKIQDSTDSHMQTNTVHLYTLRIYLCVTLVKCSSNFRNVATICQPELRYLRTCSKQFRQQQQQAVAAFTTPSVAAEAVSLERQDRKSGRKYDSEQFFDVAELHTLVCSSSFFLFCTKLWQYGSIFFTHRWPCHSNPFHCAAMCCILSWQHVI